MMACRRAWLVVLLGLAGWLGWPGTAHAAVTCSVDTNPAELAFGTLSLPLTSNTTTATVAVHCSRTKNGDSGSATVCIGTEANLSPRTMSRTTAPVATLGYNIYSDAAYSQVVGFTYNASATIAMPNLDQPYSANITLYGKLAASQPGATPGSYLDQTTSAAWGFVDAPNANCATMNQSGSYVLRATATLQGSCLISAAPLNFGSYTSLAANRDNQTTVTVTCTNGTPYTVKLDGGKAGTFNPRKLYLNGSGPGTVDYNLYTDSGRTTIWGTGGGTGNTVIGTGTGSGQGNPQALTVYGRVPASALPFSAGTYTDTVTATVEF